MIVSALHVGELKRHEVDWDWEDDGKATDDEEEMGDDQLDDDDRNVRIEIIAERVIDITRNSYSWNILVIVCVCIVLCSEK